MPSAIMLSVGISMGEDAAKTNLATARGIRNRSVDRVIMYAR